MVFGHIAPWGWNRALFHSTITVSEIMAIKICVMAAKIIKMAFELLFALRLTVSKIMATKFWSWWPSWIFEASQNAKMVFDLFHIAHWGRNWALFRSTINGFLSAGNLKTPPKGHLKAKKGRIKKNKRTKGPVGYRQYILAWRLLKNVQNTQNSLNTGPI